MFKKKVEKPINPYDEKMRTLRNELAEIGWNMDKKVKRAYLTSQAVALYKEDTPDWMQACDERESAQHSLLCSIGAYDSKRAEIWRFCRDYGDKMNESWSDTVTSHQWIERELEYLLLKK